MFENMVLRITFGPKKNEVTWGEGGELHNEEHHNLYPTLHQIFLG
jgi:hypothetical protein